MIRQQGDCVLSDEYIFYHIFGDVWKIMYGFFWRKLFEKLSKDAVGQFDLTKKDDRILDQTFYGEGAILG